MSEPQQHNAFVLPGTPEPVAVRLPRDARRTRVNTEARVLIWKTGLCARVREPVIVEPGVILRTIVALDKPATMELLVLVRNKKYYLVISY